MSRRRNSKSAKKKKQGHKSSIRSDIWSLDLSSEQKALASLTVLQYRQFLKPLVLITYWNWGQLSSLKSKERVNKLEKLIHKTVENPSPKYGKYFEKAISTHPSFCKFPSYLRRAAIQDALGIVSSFVTRWEMWKRGERKHRYAKPPRRVALSHSYPALYKGQQIRYDANYSRVDLKVWSGSDWVWLSDIKVIKHGKSRHLAERSELQSPSLIANQRGVHLSMPVKVAPNQLPESDCVCAVDLGINVRLVG